MSSRSLFDRACSMFAPAGGPVAVDVSAGEPVHPSVHFHLATGGGLTAGELGVVEGFNERMSRCIGHLLAHNPRYFDDKPFTELLPDRLEKHSTGWLATNTKTGAVTSFPFTDINPLEGLKNFLLAREKDLIAYVRNHPLHNAHATAALDKLAA